MANTNTSSSIGYRTNGYAVGRLLKRAQANMVLERFGQVDPQGQNKTLTRKYRRIEALPLAIAPVAEGIAPTGQQLQITDLSVTLDQYADAIYFSDVLQDTIEDNTLEDAVKAAAQQCSETKETVRFNALKAGTNVFYSGGTTRATVAASITRGLVRTIERTLRRNRAQVISEIVAPSAKVATEPVAPAYFAVTHTDMKADIENCTGFKPVEKYSDPTKALPGEVGAVGSIRFIVGELYAPWLAAGTAGTTYLSGGSTPSTSLAADVYPILIFGQDAYGIVPMQGKNAVKINIINPEPTIADVCGQKGAISWKMYDAALILNDLWMARAEVACTATLD